MISARTMTPPWISGSFVQKSITINLDSELPQNYTFVGNWASQVFLLHLYISNSKGLYDYLGINLSSRFSSTTYNEW